jgi:amidase
MAKALNAYVTEDYHVPPAASGGLDGLTFAVKDVFAMAGHVNTAGNPDWQRTHGPAKTHAAAIQLLLQHGAALSGITHTDELMYSLNGENFHYGTPLNPRAPDSIPGGSSSGSASAVAAGLADLALGTDTGGSVRIPSSYCGLFGMRPTHGAVSAEGVIPLAGSFDTVGWMSREPGILRAAGEVLVPPRAGSGAAGFHKIYAPGELWSLCDEEVRSVLLPLAKALAPEWFGGPAPEGLEAWASCFRTIQGYEIWDNHRSWISRVRPRFGPDIAARLDWTRTICQEAYRKQLEFRSNVRHSMEELLGDSGLLVFPTAPCPAPRIGLGGEAMDRIRSYLLQFTCLAGLSGLPQVTVPVAGQDGRPVGLSLLAGRHRDLELLRFAEQLTAAGGPWAGSILAP